MRRASRAASAVGSASASSREFVWRLCAPPRIAASAWTVVRTTLLSIDRAVRLEPAVWTWNRHICERGSLEPKRSRTIRAHIRRAARNLATSSNSSLQAAKKKLSRPAKSSMSRPRATAASAVADRVGQRVGQLLDGRRPGLAHVVAADRDRVPAGQLAGAELEDVGDQPHRRPGRVDVRPAGDVLLEDVVLGRAADGGRARRPGARPRPRTAPAGSAPSS